MRPFRWFYMYKLNLFWYDMFPVKKPDNLLTAAHTVFSGIEWKCHCQAEVSKSSLLSGGSHLVTRTHFIQWRHNGRCKLLHAHTNQQHYFRNTQYITTCCLRGCRHVPVRVPILTHAYPTFNLQGGFNVCMLHMYGAVFSWWRSEECLR